MNFHYIAEQVRNDWNNEKITPMYFKILMYIGFTGGILGIIINL